MNYDDYIRMLEQLKSDNVSQFIGSMPDVEKQAYTALLEWLNESMVTKDGRLEPTEETIRVLTEFEATYLKILNNATDYRGSVTRFLKDFDKMGGLIETFQTTYNKVKWARANISPLQRFVVNTILADYLDAGLNRHFVQPLKDLLYQNAVLGTSLRDAQKQLREFVLSGKDKSGKLSRYVTMTAQQAADSYTAAMNKRLMETFDYPYLIMSGSLIETSSPQCRKAIEEEKGVFDKQYFDKVLKPIAIEKGLKENTTFENLPFNKLHWGCRHEFTPAMVLPKRLQKQAA